jgi:hypothetical protein
MPPTAGFAPLAQSSGRIKSVVIADDTSTDLATSSGSTAVVASIVEWKLSRKVVSVGKLVTVENAADSYRVISTRRLAGGIGEVSVSIRCVVDSNSAASASSYDIFPVGAFIKFDLVRHKTRGTGYGHFGCLGRIISDDSEGAGDRGDPQMHSITVEIDGLLPAPTFTA